MATVPVDEIMQVAELGILIDNTLTKEGWTVRPPADDADYMTCYAERDGVRIRIRIDHRQRLNTNRRRRLPAT